MLVGFSSGNPPNIGTCTAGILHETMLGQLLSNSDSNYSQHGQNYLSNYLRAKVGKELPKQFPKAPSGR